ncbi:MAG: 5-formyltetrahydrofolate cyclo-ligase [Thermodesulfovibrionales bacterium]|nr:5-formyltetrahydrofolate cyclo-ligase [Thermodesulfovibrionales bacterium]
MKNSEIKKTIRRETLQRRDSIAKNLKAEKDISILQRIIMLPEFSAAKKILFYASFRSEVDTIDLIKLSLHLEKTAVLPRVCREENILRLYEIKSINELARGYMWILEPSVDEARLRKMSDIDLVIIPGAAFDTQGNRLGYGAAYYDKLLATMERKIPIVAPAYEEQIVEKIPAEPHDIKVDKIITDKRVIECTA